MTKDATFYAAYREKLAQLLRLDKKQVNLTYYRDSQDFGNAYKAFTLMPDANPYYTSATSFRVFTNAHGDAVTFRLTQFPGNCAFCVATGLEIPYDLRKRGIGNLTLAFIEQLAAAFGYTGLVVTDIKSNLATAKMFVNGGYSELYNVPNHRTQNVVAIWIKYLPKPDIA